MTGQGGFGRTIGRVLRVGSVASFALIAAGTAWALATGAPSGGAEPFTTLVANGGPDALTGAGLLALVLTPAAGLVAAAIGLWRAGEATTAGLAVVIVILLGVSAAIGLLAG